jgi:hypothetical protein
MQKHEKHCTMNPLRECRVCSSLLEKTQPSFRHLIMMLPDWRDFMKKDDYNGDIFPDYNTIEEAVKKVLPRVRDMAENCPACIMAALRQAAIPVPSISDFNFTEEMKGIWAVINEDKQIHDPDWY